MYVVQWISHLYPILAAAVVRRKCNEAWVKDFMDFVGVSSDITPLYKRTGDAHVYVLDSLNEGSQRRAAMFLKLVLILIYIGQRVPRSQVHGSGEEAEHAENQS